MNKLLTPKEAADILHVHPETLRQWEEEKLLPFKVQKTQGGHRRYPQEAIEKMIGNLPHARAQKAEVESKDAEKVLKSAIRAQEKARKLEGLSRTIGSISFLCFSISLFGILLAALLESSTLLHIMSGLLIFSFCGFLIEMMRTRAYLKYGKSKYFSMMIVPRYALLGIFFAVAGIFVSPVESWGWSMAAASALCWGCAITNGARAVISK